MKHIAIGVASSGIRAAQLSGGCAAYFCFKIPLKANYNISCGFMNRKKLLGECRLIIWDEETMSDKLSFKALDMTLQDLKHNTLLMGATTVLLVEDVMYTLPVLPKRIKTNEVNASIKSSYL